MLINDISLIRRDRKVRIKHLIYKRIRKDYRNIKFFFLDKASTSISKTLLFPCHCRGVLPIGFLQENRNRHFSYISSDSLREDPSFRREE